ncbi:MAG: hypothetical protein RLZZ546_906 [Bacteroidota bacterium]|jgi:hypothetical protein
MQTYSLPYFGEIDIDNLKNDYRINRIWEDRELSLDINFENKNISIEGFNILNNFLNGLELFDKQNRRSIFQNLIEGGDAEDYLNFYIDEFDDDELSRLIHLDNEDIDPRVQLFHLLKLVRVGMYPEFQFDKNEYAVFDYSIEIEGKMCNQLLVVVINDKGKLHHITWES